MFFSTSVELESDNCLYVCVCVCPETLGQPGDFKNGPILLKFCTLVPWVNIWGCFFHFFKIFIFGAKGPFLAQNGSKTLGQPGDFKNGPILLKFCTLVPWVNIWESFFSFFQNFHFWGHGTLFGPKRWASLETSKMF